MKSETEVSDDFEEHFASNAGHHLDPELIQETAAPRPEWGSIVKTLGFTDPEIVGTLAERAGPTIRWLRDFGVRFISSRPISSPVASREWLPWAVAWL